MPLTPIVRAAALRSTALATILLAILAVSLVLTPAYRALAAADSDKPAATAFDKPAAKDKKASDKKSSDKKASDKKASDKKTAEKKGSDKKASDKKSVSAPDKKQTTASDKKQTSPSDKKPPPTTRPVARQFHSSASRDRAGARDRVSVLAAAGR